MKQPSNKRLTVIRWLMLISFLVLMLFVGQWLYSEYHKERTRLHTEYARTMQESANQVRDSLLVVHVVDPVLQDSAYQNLSMNIVIDSLPSKNIMWKGTRVIKSEVSDTLRNTTTIKVIADSMDLNDSILRSNSGVAFYSNEDMLLQGVRLFVERLDDSTSRGGHWNSVFLMLDTARIKQIFTLLASDIDPVTSVSWITRDQCEDSLRGISRMFRYTIPSGNLLLEGTITNAWWIVLKTLIPSVIFSLVLLLLTGGSFVLAFRSLKKQIRLNAIRSRLLGNISHELKTPVATVKVALEALGRYDAQKDPEQSKEYLALATKELNRLEMLVERVMTTAFADQGGIVIRREETDLNALVREVVALMSPRLEEQSVTLTQNLPDTEVKISCDPLHIQGILINLMDNALKYGGSPLRIDLSLTENASFIELSVRDYGSGIPEEYLTQVFEKFFRVPQGDTHNRKGYGLGLSYVAMVVEQHGGTILARNQKDGGIAFVIRIPRDAGNKEHEPG